MPRLGMCLSNLNYLQNKTSRLYHIRCTFVVDVMSYFASSLELLFIILIKDYVHTTYWIALCLNKKLLGNLCEHQLSNDGTLHCRDWHGISLFHYRNVSKALFLFVNRNPIQYSFCANAKAISSGIV